MDKIILNREQHRIEFLFSFKSIFSSLSSISSIDIKWNYMSGCAVFPGTVSVHTVYFPSLIPNVSVRSLNKEGVCVQYRFLLNKTGTQWCKKQR